MIITSKSNPLIKEISKLADKKYRKITGKYLVEGIKPVRECVGAGFCVERIVCVEELASQFPEAILVSRAVFESISSEKTPQGVIAVVRTPQLTLAPPRESCILLDCLQDSGNLGTIIRTANAAGYRDLYLINCADPYSPKTVRASMSGIFFVNIFQGSRDEILNVLKGIPLICADMDGENIYNFMPPEKFCLCIGNEGNGINGELIKKADYKISIPMEKTCESLNAGVSGGIAMYQLKFGKTR